MDGPVSRNEAVFLAFSPASFPANWKKKRLFIGNEIIASSLFVFLIWKSLSLLAKDGKREILENN